MAIHKRGNLWWCDFVIEGKRYRQSLGTPEKDEAKRIHDRLKAEAWQIAKEPQRHLFAAAIGLWLDAGERDASDRYRIRAFNLHDHPLNTITETVLADILAKHRPASRNRCINLLTAILNCAVKRGWLDRVPHMARAKVAAGRTRWLTHAEWARLEAELPRHLRQMARFAIATGLRENNVIGLEWSQVDLQRKVAWIHADQAKGKKSIGIPLSDSAAAVLREQIGEHQRFVFVYEGKPVGKTSTKAWKASLMRAGIDVVTRKSGDVEAETSSFRWHDLRHTWASWHVMNGTPLEVLQKLGGWQTLTMVLRYAHLAPEYLASYANNARHGDVVQEATEANNGG